jgi:hypothetical protein
MTRRNYEAGILWRSHVSAPRPSRRRAVHGQPWEPLPSSLLWPGFQSWAHTPVGNPFAALANGIAGLSSGQRTDPAATGQQIIQPGAAFSANAQQSLNTQYQALRPILGDTKAMLAIVHPETGRTLIAQALASQTRPGNTADAGPSGGGQVGVSDSANSIAAGPPPGLTKAGYVEIPTNANQAFGELLGIQASKEEHTISGKDYVSGVREGNVRQNSDRSLDVTNGTVVTLSYKDGHAKIITVTDPHIAHIDPKTGEAVIQMSP